MSDIMALTEEYNKIKNSGKKLDMSRGKPSPAQLDIAEKMLTVLSASSDCIAENGIDCRNYGVLGGIPEVRRLFAEAGKIDILINNAGFGVFGEFEKTDLDR